ncbi:hypothetical protein AHAS_Ahas08G0035200 [Arachis hypogaea]
MKWTNQVQRPRIESTPCGTRELEEFFIETVPGKHNDNIALALFSGDLERGLKLAKEQVKPLNGLNKVREWIESRGLKRAAVTNVPRPNAKLMISLLGLSDFFHAVIIGGECEHAKPMHACTGPTH